MSEEDDDDFAKPFIGKRGPRKTKPRGASPAADNVRRLFGEEEAKGVEERHGIPPPERLPKKKRTRVRLGKRMTDILERIDVEGLTMAQVVRELSPEELARGQFKDKAGYFRGAPPKWVPAEFHRECIRELMRRGKVLYQESYLDAVRVMLTVANDPRVEPRDRLKAAQFVIERIEGKVPERLEVSASEPWQELLAGIVVDVPAEVPMRKFEGIEGT